MISYIYSCRNALTGSRQAAFTAGYKPEANPTPPAIRIETTTDHRVNTVSQPATLLIITALPAPSMIPTHPPAVVSTMASHRNCTTMCF